MNFARLIVFLILKVSQLTTKELIIDNVYTVNQNEHAVLKCPIELSKQPLKEEVASEMPKVVEPSSEYYDYAEGDKIDEPINVDKLSKRSVDDDRLFIVQWFKDTTRIGKQARLKQDGAYLRIRNVNTNDAGKYKCKLINGFGSVTTTLTLNVLTSKTTTIPTPTLQTATAITTATDSGRVDFDEVERSASPMRAPVFTFPERMQPKSLRKKKGAQVRFKCRASGVPRPDIVWFKNGEILNEEEFGITR